MTMKYKKIVTIVSIMISMSIWVNVISAQNTLKVGEVTANPGEKKSGFIIVPAGKDGSEQKIPITIINGKKLGPVLALVAGIHGYEYPPILALQRLPKKLDPSGLSGAVLMVHVANMPSFLKRTIYYNPHDWVNLNRAFPGKIDGSMCERIAYQITNEVIKQCDYLIDMHCGDGNEDLMPYLYCTKVDNPEVDKKTKELAINFGLKLIVGDLGRPKDLSQSVYCGNTALLMGKPAITIESGKLGGIDEEDVDAVVLDLATPWLVVDKAHGALTGGGVFASFSPTIEQVMKTVSALKTHSYVEVNTVELILRRINVAEDRTRPETVMIGHSGYITTARKVLD